MSTPQHSHEFRWQHMITPPTRQSQPHAFEYVGGRSTQQGSCTQPRRANIFFRAVEFLVNPVSSVPITSGGIVVSPRRSDAHIPVLLNKWGASAMSDTWDLAGGAMFAAVRRRELRSNRQESTLQNEPVRHQLRGSGRARSRELPGHTGGHAVESGPAAQDRTRLSRTAPPPSRSTPSDPA